MESDSKRADDNAPEQDAGQRNNDRSQHSREASTERERNRTDRDHDDGEDHEPKKKRRWPIILLGLAVILAVAAGVYYWLSRRGLESTDDAYTDGNSIVIAPKVAGYVTDLQVTDNLVVQAGDVLYRIDQRDYLAQRSQAVANLSMARAQLSSAQVNLEMTRIKAPASLDQALAQLAQAKAGKEQADQNARRQRAVDPRATTQVNIDQATAQARSNSASVDQAAANVRSAGLVKEQIQTAEDQVKQNEAQVAQAEANLAQADVNLSYTVLRAPQAGRITQRTVNLGNYVQAGQQSFYIVAPVVWVTANFKETQLDQIRPGQSVTMTVDAYPDLKLRGHVDSIQQGSGAQFSAFPAQNATGNFVKIVRRVPVKVVIDSGLPKGPPLPLGISVVATVDVR